MLTVKQLNGIKPTGRPYRLFDGDRSGFGVQVTAKGRISFFQQYTSPEGKRRFIHLGHYPKLALEKARREEAFKAREIVKEGRDPQQVREEREKERDEARRKKKDEPTVADAVPDYLRLYRGRPSEKAIARYFENDVVPAIGGLNVKDVRRRDVLDMVEKKATNTPTAARHLLVYTKGFFDWCLDREYLDQSPAAGIKPKNIRAEGKKNVLANVQRARVLSDAEMRAFWYSVEGCGMRRLTALALKLTLVTGQRPGEVAGMRWDEVEEGVWTIPASRRGKTDSSHTVPLSPLALSLLEEAREEAERLQARRATEATGYVFEAVPGKPLTVNALSKAVGRYTDALGMKGEAWRPHDLRRTMRTGLAMLGFLDEVSEATIGHVKQGILAVYNQHGYDADKRKALDAWAAHLEGACSVRVDGRALSATVSVSEGFSLPILWGRAAACLENAESVPDTRRAP
ncbi:tyrosine-type recombinase/integrase [Thioalkalivibrio sp. ALMg11]|uniref:tyrosine-type recombinase/integrase n=1 Tax=Thioalkalivibrio sp. ALMg11 TaxID=1158165 RepID=UPI000368F705|nr:tyrosine-type recombinase/integrase [Thioalkalivibrio sp. ALMg11]